MRCMSRAVPVTGPPTFGLWVELLLALTVGAVWTFASFALLLVHGLGEEGGPPLPPHWLQWPTLILPSVAIVVWVTRRWTTGRAHRMIAWTAGLVAMAWAVVEYAQVTY